MSEEKKTVDAERIAKIDAAIARANAAKAAGATAGVPGETAEDRAKRLTADRAQMQVKKDQERDAKRAERQVELEKMREQRKLDREAKRLVKDAELASRKPAHLSKVEKAAANLPPMNEDTQLVFDEAKKLNRTDIEILASHLSFESRKSATLQAAGSNLKVGQEVVVISGQARYIGRSGVVTKVQRIRCFVQLDGDKEIYLFTSDVAPAAVAAEADEVAEPVEVRSEIPAETVTEVAESA